MTKNHVTEYDLVDRITELEEWRRQVGSGGGIAGLQILGDGKPFFQGGFYTGTPNLKIYEPVVLPTPTGVNAVWGTSGDVIYVDVTWTAAAGYGADAIASYTVQLYKMNSLDPEDETYDPIAMELSASADEASSIRFQPVEPNTRYKAVVWAVSRNGRNSLAGEDFVTTGQDDQPPAAPDGIEVFAGVMSLLIKWDSNTEPDTAYGKGMYRVVVSENEDLSAPAFDGTTSALVLHAANLQGGTDYWVGVYAIDSSGNQSALGVPAGGPWTTEYIITDDIAFSFGGGNIVRNSGFEGDFPDQWGVHANGATITKDTSVAHGSFGPSSLKISGASADAWIQQDVPALTKGTWILSAWVKATSVATMGGAGVVLHSSVISGTVEGYTVLFDGSLIGGDSVNLGTGTFDWKRVALRFTVTSSTSFLRFFLQRGYGGPCSGTAWFDEVQLEQGDTITGYAPRPDEILGNTIKSTMISDDQITTPKLAAFSVVAGKIAANSIGTNELQAVSITTAKLAAQSVTTNILAAGSVNAEKLQVGSINADHIQTNSLYAHHFAANSVSANSLQAIALGIGKYIQSNVFVPGVSGFRIGSAGDAEFNNATIRGSLFTAGTIQIANRIYASPSDSAVHLAANCEIGADYSGTVYSGDLNWGLQIGNNGLGAFWTDMRAYLQPGSERYIGFFDTYRNRRLFYADASANLIKSAPDGCLIVGKVDQHGDWGTKAIRSQNSVGAGNLDHAGISFHTPASGVATILQMVSTVGQGLEIRTGDNGGFAPLKASAFLVNSAAEAKNAIHELGASTIDRFQDLRTVRYKRSETKTKCAACVNTGKVTVKDYTYGVDDEGNPVPYAVGSKCPVHSGASLTRSEAARSYEDSDFIGFLADNVAEVSPALVGYVDDNGVPKADSIDTTGILALTVAQVQRLTKEVQDLKKKAM